MYGKPEFLLGILGRLGEVKNNSPVRINSVSVVATDTFHIRPMGEKCSW